MINTVKRVAGVSAFLFAQSLAANTLFQGEINKEWHWAVQNGQQTVTLDKLETLFPGKTIQVNHQQANDVHTTAISWNNPGWAELSVVRKTPVNYERDAMKGIQFSIRVNELSRGGITFAMQCAPTGCRRPTPFTLMAKQLAEQKDWQEVFVPLSCFKREGDDFSSMTKPLAMEFNGSGAIDIKNMDVVSAPSKTAKTLSCADYKTVSVTPDTLNEWWATDWWMARHNSKKADAKALLASGKKIDVLLVGDSITQGWEAKGKAAFDKYLAPKHAFEMGFGGDRTENLLWRLQNGALDGLSPKVTVVMIGTNNTGHRNENPQTTANGIKAVLNEIHARLPNTKILLLAVFPRDADVDGERRVINEGVNNIIAEFGNEKTIFFRNINNIFLDEKGHLSKEVMPDLLHPEEHGYELYGKALAKELDKLL